MKRFTKLLLTMAMLVSASLSTFAERFAHTFAGQTVYYERTENYTARVDYCPVTVSGGVAIPDEVSYQGAVWGPVTAVASNAFEDCIYITAVSLPASVTSIGAGAFKNCTSLTSVMLTASNERVDFSWYAFYGCSDEVYNSFDNAFYIGTEANPYLYLMKAASTDITSCQIHPDCKYINGYAFEDCDKLTEISIPNTITYIGNYAFSGCSSLASLTLSSNVTTIGQYAYDGCSSLTTVTVPRSVTSIGSSAFGGCSALESITLPFVGSAAITSIDVDRYPFGYIFGTTSFEGAVETKQYYKKAGEGSSRSVVYYIPSSLKTVTIDVAAANDVAIMENAFINCTELTSVSLNQVTSIEKYAFEGCTSLTTITVPQSVTSIARGAFRGCMALETMTLPFPGTQKYTPDMVETELSENNGALANGNTGLECGFLFGTIFQSGNWDPDKLPSTLRTVTFTNCEYLPYNTFHHNANYSDWNITSVTLPNNLTSIGEKAFCNCPGLTSVTIPNNVTTVGENAYEGCASITSITTGCTVDLSATKLTFSKDGFNYRVLNKSTVELTGSSNTTGTVTIPATVTCGNTFTVISIAEYAFGSGFSNVNLISVPETVSTIGYHAFSNVPLLFYTGTAEGSPWGALALCHVIDGDFVYSDGEKTQLVGYLGTGGDVVVPSTVTEIHPATFKNCVGLTSVKIPSSVTSISGSAFSGCTNLTKVTLNNNAIASKTYTSSSNIKTIFGSQVEEYVLGEDVTSIGDYAFYGCTSLTSITIPEIVTSIGEHAFWGCTGLISITIPEDVISIGESAFNGCTGLTSVTIPKNVTSIGAYAFSNCSNAQEFVFEGETPPTFGGSYLFEDSTCPIYVPNASAVTAYKAAVGSRYASRVTIMPVTIIVDGIKYDLQNDGTFAVVANNYSDEIIIPSSIDYNGVATAVTSIAANAFENCVGLTAVTIPSSVTSIESDAFIGCTNLTKVTLNSNAIASKTYTSSSNLTTIFGSQVEEYVLGEDVASIGSYAFYGCTGLPSVTIPSNVTSVGGSAFGGCTNLTKVTINSNAVASSGSSLKNIFGTQVPEYVLGEDVTKIGNNAFFGCTGLTSVTIPEGVTSIGGSAFDGCTDLTLISLPEGVTEIGGYAFNRCTSLTSVTIPSSVTTIVGSAFYYCDNLKKVTINSNAIASKTYTYNSNLGNIFGQQVTEYVLGDDVTSIGEYAFDACTGLASVTIPEGVTSIGGSAFYSCTGLTSITIPEGVTTIDDYTFYNCKKLTSITIPEGVTSIGNSAFEDCKNVQMFVFEKETPPAFGSDVFKNSTCPIYVPNASAVTVYKAADNMNSYADRVKIMPTIVIVDGIKYQLQDDGTFAVIANNYSGDVVIPSSIDYNGVATTVSSIDANAFYGCTDLTAVTIPSSITSIESDAFKSCTNLTKVILNSNAIASNTYTYYSNLGNIFGKQVAEYVLGEDVTSIGEYAFYGCTDLTSITIPEGVTSIGNYAFDGCYGLTSVTIPKNVMSIGDYAFYNCTGFTSITIPEGVTTIGSYAFYNCTGLTSVTIPSSVTLIGSDAFKSCTNLTKVTLNSNAVASYNSYNTYNFNFYTIFGFQVTEYVLGEGVTSIGDYAFYGCTRLTSVTIPEGVTSIGNNTFYNCTDLTSITIPEGVTSIGNSAFYGCTGLTSVTIPEGVTSIGNSAFYNCKKLTSIIIPESVRSIGNYVFYNCSKVQEFVFEDETPPTFGTKVFYGSSCPIYVPTLEAVTAYKAADNMSDYKSRIRVMPIFVVVDGVKYQLLDNGTFAVVANNYSGEVNTIRESIDYNGVATAVTSIAANAFYGCTDLTSVTIPSSITSIESDAFKSCTNLTKVILNSNAIASKQYTSSSNLKNIFGSQVTEYVLGEGVTSIGEYAFYGCTDLTSITIPEGVTSIGNYAFYGCYGLTSVTIPEGVTEIGYNAFQNCTGLTSITIPSSITTIRTYAFSDCTNLTKVTLYSNAVVSGDYTLSNMFGRVTEFIIGSDVTEIGNYVFGNCKMVQKFVFEGETPPTFGYSVFYGSSCPIYVPTLEAVTAYKAANNMSSFASRVQVMPIYTISVVANNDEYGTVSGGGTYNALITPTVTISAMAIEPYQFAYWNEDGSTEATRTITITENATYTAVFKRAITISNISAAEKVYDGTTAAQINYTTDGILEGDDVTVNCTASFDDKNVGIEKTVTLHFELEGEDASNYTIVAETTDLKANITPAPLALIDLTALNKVYDGTTTATVTYSANGIVENDDVTVEPTATFADKNVGDDKVVTYSFAKSGEDADNYTLSVETVDLKANITAKEISINEIVANDKEYDGTTTATATFTMVGAIENEDVAVNYTATFDDKNAEENKTVSLTFELAGEDIANYVLASSTATATAEVTAKSIAVSNITAGEKVYDGETTATLAFELDGVLENDEVEVYYTANFADENVGEDKAVTFNFAKSGADEANYELAVEATEPKAAITAYTSVEVTITENSGTETYDGTEKTVTGYTVEINTELYTESDFAFNGTAEVRGTNAGEYEMNIVASDFENTNTNFADVKFTVVDCKLTIEKSAETPNMPEVTAETRLLNITDVALPEGWAWADETLALVEGENSAVANYVGDDAGNYTVESVTITITRLPCLHDGEYTIVDAKEATCTADGYTGDHKCSICGAIFEQGSVIPAKGHNAGEPVIENYIAPTCKEAGSVDTVYYCTIDGDLISRETYVLPIVDHVPGKKVAENIIPATTTTEGSVDSVVYCMVGGEELSREHFVLPILDHEHIAGEPVVENYVAPTCTEAGAVDTVVYCTVNGEELSREHYVLPAPGHQPSEKVAKNYIAPTCLVAGSVDSVITCLVCGEVLSNEHFDLPATGHIAGEPVIENYTAPTCKEAGSVDTLYYCTIDGDLISKETYVLPILDHVPGDKVAENIIPATTTTEGSVDSVVYCMVGGEELSREHFVLPILDHEHIAGAPKEENRKEPTCLVDGSVDTVVYCTVNGEELSREHYVLPAPGHKAGEPVIENYTAPTCKEAGSVDTVYYCTIDGEEISRETYVLPILDHVPGKKVAENIVPATTTTEGSVDSVVYCMIGGEELSREHFVLPILDHEHIAGTPVVENYVAPTFTTEGSVDSVVYCTVCGEELSRETFTLPMLQKAIEKIEILSMPKTEYTVGEELDITGAKISVTFNDGSVEEIDLTNEMLTGFDNTLVAEQEITITYLTFTTTIKVTVKDEGTAISDVAGDETVIYAYGHTIVVKTTNTGDIIVNDVNGRIVAKSQSNGDRTEIYVPKVGVYAVRIGTVSQKVVIR